jgi:sugar/nucleoside kinase (ribokinase family)
MAESKPELLCIGNALVDVFARIEGDIERDIEARFGLTKPVQHVDIEKLQEIIALLPETKLVSGGGAANVAKIAGLLGIRAGFIGATGSGPEPAVEPEGRGSPPGDGADRFGGVFAGDLAAAGVELFLARKSPPTGVCLMLRKGAGETIIAAAPSASLELAPEDIDEGLIKSARVVMIDGFMLNRKNLVIHILDLANKYGTVAALDAGSTGLAGEQAWEIATYSRLYPLILFMNEEEAVTFHQILSRQEGEGTGERTLTREASGFFENFTAANLFPVAAVKLGKRGAVVFAGGSVYHAETIPLAAAETTGAGDAFAAAFLGGWIRRKSLSQCAALGNKAAREALTVPGTELDRKRLKALVKQLERQKK